MSESDLLMGGTHLLITGGTGFIGQALCRKLKGDGAVITVLTRSRVRARELLGNDISFIEALPELHDSRTVDAIVNLAGAPLADRRWTASRKKEFFASRVGLTDELHRFFSQGILPPPGVVVSGSAVGYYGPHGSEILDESGTPVDSFSSELCEVWENAAIRFESLGARVCLSRTGIVLGDGGALKAMLPVFKMGAGGPIGSGEQWMSWIHLNDMVRLIAFCLNCESISGPVNATAPEPVTNKEFSQTLARVLGRPCFMKVPALAMKAIYGEMAEELLLSGQRVVPRMLESKGFDFEFATLEGALKEVLA